MSESEDGHKGMAKRLVPLIKIAIAAALIAFLLWFVPMRDHLRLAGATAADDRTIVGTLLLRTDEQAILRDVDGATWQIALDGDKVLAVTQPDGTPLVLAAQAGRTSALEAGLISTVRNVSMFHLGMALLLLFMGSMIAVYRWYLLLRAVDLGIPFGRAFSLTFIGTFFNNIMPGLTGGDLVKAYYIARDHSQRKTEAIITVLLDRVLGLTGLAIVAGLMIPVDLARYREVAPWIYGLLLCEAAFGCLFFSRRLRRMLGIDALLAKLPFGEVVAKIDRAVFMYRYRRRTLMVSLLLSMVVHGIIVTAIGMIGVGLGLGLDFKSYFAIVPIGLIASALPIAPAGIGLAEATLVYFLRTVGVSKSGALSLAFLYRIAQAAISLIGGLCLARLKDRLSAREMEQFAESDDNAGKPGGADPAGNVASNV